MDITPILETWQIHNRINIYLLEHIQDEFLSDVSASKGREIADQFAHIHNVRLMWLKEAAPGLLEGLEKFESKSNPSKAALNDALMASGKAVETLLEKALNTDNRVKGFKPHATAFLGYLISHESHHRGQIMLTLKQSGHLNDKKLGFGLWEWGVR